MVKFRLLLIATEILLTCTKQRDEKYLLVFDMKSWCVYKYYILGGKKPQKWHKSVLFCLAIFIQILYQQSRSHVQTTMSSPCPYTIWWEPDDFLMISNHKSRRVARDYSNICGYSLKYSFFLYTFSKALEKKKKSSV